MQFLFRIIVTGVRFIVLDFHSLNLYFQTFDMVKLWDSPGRKQTHE